MLIEKQMYVPPVHAPERNTNQERPYPKLENNVLFHQTAQNR